MMNKITNALSVRSNNTCELCAAEPATTAFTVSPKSSESIDNQVALCNTCCSALDQKDAHVHWQCLAGSIWNTTPSVQALSYRICYQYKGTSWADEIISSVELEESVVNWALTAFEQPEVHKDANGVELANGDSIILTQSLNVKGTSFSIPKGTIVRKIRLVAGNTEQIEGKVNEQTIVILTKFTRKSS